MGYIVTLTDLFRIDVEKTVRFDNEKKEMMQIQFFILVERRRKILNKVKLFHIIKENGRYLMS